jgi:L-lactate dehydrogenase complex protein LldG
MNDARSAILGRIAAALADGPAPVAIPRDYRRTTPPEVDLVERFAERVADYRATVHRTSRATLAATVAQVLAERGIGRLVVPTGIPDDWLATSEVTRLGDDPPLSHRDLDAADGVLTGCAVAIAETGTIVLDAGPGQGRRALSLLPDRHLCIVEADRIVGDVPEALARLEPRRPLTWISGPSATSDIELERVEGVHGPRVLDVVIVED